MAYLKLPFLQTWDCGFADLAKLYISRIGTSPQGISRDAVLVDQHIAKKCLIHAQFYSFKRSHKSERKNLDAFSSVKSEIQQNTNGLPTVSRIYSTIFQEVRMHFCTLILIQAPTNSSYHIISSPVLFLSKQGQRRSEESCIVLENGPTCSLIVKLALIAYSIRI